MINAAVVATWVAVVPLVVVLLVGAYLGARREEESERDAATHGEE